MKKNNALTLEKGPLVVIEACPEAGEWVLSKQLLPAVYFSRLVLLTDSPTLQHRPEEDNGRRLLRQLG